MAWSEEAEQRARQSLSRRGLATYLLAIVALWAVLYGSFSLLRPPLLDDADSVHAEVAREMLVRHNWITLHANGIRYLEKAPLLYWSMAASFRVFGVSTWAARLPLALYTLALLGMTFVLGQQLFRHRGPAQAARAGFYAALILATSFGIFIFTRFQIPDVMVCLWLALSIYCFHRSLSRPSRLSACGFAAACALNVLTKGLIGVVFPLGIVVLYLLLVRNLNHLRRWHPLLGTGVFLLLAAPWHIAAGLANPGVGHPGALPTDGNVHGFFWFYFLNEHLYRYLNMRVPRDYDTVPLALFWGLVLVWILPWCAFVFAPLRRTPWLKALRGEKLIAEDSAHLLLSLWALSVLIFFSFSTRQEYYVLPALPALALLASGWLAAQDDSPTSRLGLRLSYWLFAGGIAGAAAAAFLAWRGTPPPPGTDLSALLQQNPQEYALSFGHFLDLNARAMGAFRLPLVLTATALLLGTTAHLLLHRAGRRFAANCALAAMMALFLVAAHLALTVFSPVLSSATLAESLRPRLKPQDMVIIHGEYEAGSTLGFYLGDRLGGPIHIWNGRSSNLWYGSFFPDAPRIFETDASMGQRWPAPQRLYVWTEPGTLPALPGHVYVLKEEGGKQLVSNQP